MNSPGALDSQTAQDAVPAFEIVRTETLATPFVVASPHSGRFYPDDMMEAALLDAAAIRRSEDAFVDALAGRATGLGIPLISATFARAYMDLNREPYELDPAMFEGELPAHARSRTARVAAGLGSIARVVGEGQEIYARKLTFEEAEARIETVYRPYHDALAGLLNEARQAFGYAILVDVHSMPSAAAVVDGPRGRRACDFVLGDRFGAACSPQVAGLVEAELAAMGYAVNRNAPYAGGFITESYGRPQQGVHALQIEINRALYLDERDLRRHHGFARLAADLDRLFAALAAADWSGLAPA